MELYRKIYIKSEEDLPKGGSYICHFKLNQMKNEDELINRIAEVYKPYKTEAEKLRELAAELHETKLRVKRLEEFCKLQVQMNEDLVMFLKLTEL